MVVPIALGALALALAPLTQGQLFPTIACFMLAFVGFKSYLPAFWSLPSIFRVPPSFIPIQRTGFMPNIPKLRDKSRVR